MHRYRFQFFYLFFFFLPVFVFYDCLNIGGEKCPFYKFNLRSTSRVAIYPSIEKHTNNLTNTYLLPIIKQNHAIAIKTNKCRSRGKCFKHSIA